MTIDGFCDHTAGIADDELHQHYTDLLSNAGTILYGRKTYQLMESYWPSVVAQPTGNKSMDDFAVTIDNLPKIVFSRTLKSVDWKRASIAEKSLEEEISDLKQQPGKDVLIGSPSLIVQATNFHVVDEYQLCIHPVLVGKGLPLFNIVNDRMVFNLKQTKRFGSGAIVLYYEKRGEG